MPTHTVTRALLALALMFGSSRAWAIEISVPCETPSVFSNAAVNVVVLPYSQPASIGSSSRAGEQLGALVHLEAVLAVAKFGSVGIVQLVGSDRVCAPDRVADMLLGKRPGSPEKLKAGGGLVLVWGRIFESGPDLYLQTFVRFLRAGLDESIDLTFRDRTFRGGLSTQAFACAPRKIAVRDLDDIQRQYSSARLLHTQPDASSPTVRMPEGQGPFSYSIAEVRGDWVLMQPMSRNPGVGAPLAKGWLLARAPDAQWSLRRQMPELYAVEGIAGYLSARVRGGSGLESALQASDTALSRYLEAWGVNAVLGSDAAAGGTPLAVAVPRQVRGFVTLLAGRGSNMSLIDARMQFERAALLAPQNSNARNLVTMVTLALAYRQPSADLPPRRMLEDWRVQLGADPDNASILANLSAAYDLVLAPPAATPPSWAISAADQQQLTKQRDSLRPLVRR